MLVLVVEEASGKKAMVAWEKMIHIVDSGSIESVIVSS